MDQKALFTLSYGVFILAAENNGAKNACIINTCQQIASEPLKVSISVLKSNLTNYMVAASGKFSLSVLGEHVALEQIAHFGFNSGRDKNKFEGITYETDALGTPVIKEGAVAVLSCKVTEQVDLGSHTLFIADVVEAEKVSQHVPMTYAYYRDLKAGKAGPKQTADTISAEPVEKVADEQYECSICHYIYDGDVPFDELPEDYVCPVCGQPKSVFLKA